MTKAEIAERIYQKTGYTRSISLSIVNEVFDIIKESANKGEVVKISGFGNFLPKQKKARKGHNPKTGAAILIPPRRVLKFKPGLTLKKKFSEKGAKNIF